MYIESIHFKAVSGYAGNVKAPCGRRNSKLIGVTSWMIDAFKAFGTVPSRLSIWACQEIQEIFPLFVWYEALFEEIRSIKPLTKQIWSKQTIIIQFLITFYELWLSINRNLRITMHVSIVGFLTPWQYLFCLIVALTFGLLPVSDIHWACTVDWPNINGSMHSTDPHFDITEKWKGIFLTRASDILLYQTKTHRNEISNMT